MARMANKGRKYYFGPDPEEPKDNEDIPEGLGIGVKEERDLYGQLAIYLQPDPNASKKWAITPYVILGKYKDGRYYVSDWTQHRVNLKVTKHEHLLTAIAQIHELAEAYGKG